CTRRTRPTTARAARPATGCSPIAGSRVCSSRTGRARSTSWSATWRPGEEEETDRELSLRDPARDSPRGPQDLAARGVELRRRRLDGPALPARRSCVGGGPARTGGGVRLPLRLPDRRRAGVQPARARHPRALESARGDEEGAEPAWARRQLSDAAHVERRRIS